MGVGVGGEGGGRTIFLCRGYRNIGFDKLSHRFPLPLTD